MGQERNWEMTALDSEYYLCITIWLWCIDVGLLLLDDGQLPSECAGVTCRLSTLLLKQMK